MNNEYSVSSTMIKKMALPTLLLFAITAVSQSMNSELGNYSNITLSDAFEIVSSQENVWLIDVRTEKEFKYDPESNHSNIGRLRGAINMPLKTFEIEFEKEGVPKEAHVILYCSHANRSRFAGTYLRKTGYENVYNIIGGLSRWTGYEDSEFDKKEEFIIHDSPIKFLSPSQLCELNKQTVFIDTRSIDLNEPIQSKGTALGSFKNAIHIPLKEITSLSIGEMEKALTQLPKDKELPIVVYDVYNNSIRAALSFSIIGYTNVSILADGINNLLQNKPDCLDKIFSEYKTEYKNIKPAELCELLRTESKMQLLDVRPKVKFEMPASEGHLNDGYLLGAINIDEKILNEQYDRLNKDLPIVVYGTNWMDAGRGADKLVALGFKRVYRMGGGMREWYNLSLEQLPCRDEIGRNLR